MTLLLLLQAVAIPWNDSGPRPRENGRRVCWSYSGKGASALEITKANPLEFYLQNLPSFDAEIKWRVDHEQWRDITGKTTRIGKFGPLDVVDILFSIPRSNAPFGKMVLLGREGSFKPLIWIIDDTGITLSPSTVIQLSNRQVLSNRCRVSGIGGVYLEDYFVFDDKKQIPVHLRAKELIRDALREVLPKGSEWRDGGFEIGSLRFVSPVYSRSDAAIGGRIEIKFQLDDDHLTIVRANYDPSFQSK